MIGYTLRRLLVTVPLVALVAFGTFALIHLIPGDAASSLAGDNATPEEIAALREELGFDAPMVVQFGRWIGATFQGDFGTSLSYHLPVLEVIGQRLAVTISVMVVGLALSLLIGIPAGIIAGLKSGSVTDRVVTGVTTLGLSIPSFWLAMLLIGTFAITLNLFDATGFVPITESVGGWARSLVLPGVAVAVGSAADIARQTRSSVASVAGEDYIRTSRAMGLTSRAISYKHILRNSGIPVVTVASLQLERLISGAIVVEVLFAMPGIGQLTLTAVQAQDVPMVQGLVVLIAMTIILTNLLVDLSYAWINPKLRRR